MAISFNAEFYLEQKLAQLQESGETGFETTADVAAALEAADLTAEAHYEQYGVIEDLDPNTAFDTSVYLNQKLIQLQSAGETQYQNVNDVIEVFQAAGLSPLEHYNQYGAAEALSPNAAFNVQAYLEDKLAQLQADGVEGFENTADVLAAFQSAGLTPLDHFQQFGQDEGLVAKPVENAEPEEPVDPGVPGETFMLTEGRDNLTGTDNDDTFYGDVGQNDMGAVSNALSTGDVIDGGAGRDSIEATLINDSVVEDDATANARMSINARTENVEEVYLSSLDENVVVDAGRMNAVDQFWSDDSDANLVLEDVRLGDGQSITKDITFGMRDVDQQSGLSAAFETQSLTNEGTTQSNSQLEIRIADVSTETPLTPLANVNVNLSFDLGEENVELTGIQSTDGSYAGLVTAIESALAQEGYGNLNVDLSDTYADVTVGQNTVTLPFTAQEILVTDPNGEEFSNITFTQSAIESVPDGFLVAGNAQAVDPSTSTTLIETNLVLDNAGRGSTAGDAVIGGMSNSGQTIEKLNLVVDRDSRIDDLATASGMENNAFNGLFYVGFGEIELTSSGANGLLSVNDIQNTTTFNANAFEGASLTIGNADALQTLNANIGGDVTFNADIAAAQNAYTTGGGSDVVSVAFSTDDIDALGTGLTINTNAGDDSVSLTNGNIVGDASQQTMAELKNVSVNTGAGDDNVVINGDVRTDINAGAGSDYVYINADATGTTGTWAFGQSSGPQAFGERTLYQAELTVTFAGFENTVTVDTDVAGNYVADQTDINAAIIEAISSHADLNRLLTTNEGEAAQQLIVQSLVDGENDLAVEINQPTVVANNPTAGQVQAPGSLNELIQGLIDTTALDSDDFDNGAADVEAAFANLGYNGNVDANGGTTAALYQDFLAGGSSDATGDVNFSVINMGTGADDLVVLDANANSANVLEIDGTFGDVSVVNFHDASPNDVTAISEVGNHALDFTSLLNNQTDASTAQQNNQQSAQNIAVTLNTNAQLAGSAASTGVALANSVNMLNFDETLTDSVSFGDLTAAQLVSALNGDAGTTVTGGLVDGTLDATASTANLVGNTQQHIVMVENDQNPGEYKVFSLSSTVDADSGTTDGEFDTGSALELGTMDFGQSINFDLVGSGDWETKVEQLIADADGREVPSEEPTDAPTEEPTDAPTEEPSNLVEVDVPVDGEFNYTATATAEDDTFDFNSASEPDNLVATVTITDFSAGDSVNLQDTGANDFQPVDILGNAVGGLTDVSIVDGNMQVVLLDAGANQDFNDTDTWTLSFQNVDQGIIDAVNGAADVDAAEAAVAGVWGQDWLVL